MGNKSFVFQCRGDAYYYKEHSDGTSSIYPLELSSTLGILHLATGLSATTPRDIPPREEWVLCPEYKLGWRRINIPDSPFVELEIVLYCWERVKEDIRNSIYPSLQDCMVYACKHVLSRMGRMVTIPGVGMIYSYNGAIHISRQSHSKWELVE